MDATHDFSFRDYLPDLSTERFQNIRIQDAYEYMESFLKNKIPIELYKLSRYWRNELFTVPFKGVTTDGNVINNLYSIRDEGVPIHDIVTSVKRLFGLLSTSDTKKLCYPFDSREWRSWSNPEFYISQKGIRLDEVSPEVQNAVHNILRTTLSPEGYEKALAAMKINHFLGELVQGQKVMNIHSYNFVLFGEASEERPWGFSCYGHHLCLNVMLYRSQIVVAPFFTGAEPNLIDDGPYNGARICYVEEQIGLELMQSLSPEDQAKAQIFKELRDPAMPEDRWNRDDQRHLCGAYRDNRIVPYEGVLVDYFTAQQKDMVLKIVEQFLLYLPLKSRMLKLEDVKDFFSETYFCWIGGFNDDDAFYFRIQSPVIIVEFDHHSGVFLANEEPKKFHIHTILRYPNAGDYGYALRKIIPGVETKEI
ncbi:hypothetical protein V1511DRAFT_512455 [Dipodascopsis uninucleata]